MKQMIINGCELDSAALFPLLQSLNLVMAGDERQVVDLKSSRLHGCLGCDACQSVHPGICAIDDGLNQLLERYLACDRVILATSIQFGSFHARIKHFIDRTEPLFLPYQYKWKGRTRMKPRYDCYPELLIVGVQGTEDNESANAFRNCAKDCCLALASPSVAVTVVRQSEFGFLEQKG